jgi:hypothetical protein
MSRLTQAAARAITKDWAALFPEFGIWRPLRLLRRVGPWVQGITLERSSAGDDYLPVAHVHALTRPFPTISLTLANPLHYRAGVAERIMVKHHADSYVDAARRLAECSDLPLDSAPTLPQILSAYHAFISERRANGVPAAYVELEDIMDGPSVLALAGPTRDGLVLVDAVREATNLAAAEAALWSSGPPGYSTPAQWLEHVLARAADATALARCVAEQVAQHQLDALPPAWSK